MEIKSSLKKIFNAVLCNINNKELCCVCQEEIKDGELRVSINMNTKRAHVRCADKIKENYYG